MSFKKEFIKNILISGGYNYLAQGISFFSSVILSRLLTPESYGFVGIITVFTGFLTIFSDSGVSLAVIRSDYAYTYHKSVESLSLVIGIILFSLTSVLSVPISIFFKNSELILPMIFMSLSFIIRSMTLVRGALLAKEMNFGYLGYINLITVISTISLTIILAYAGAGYWSLIIPQTLSGLVILIIQERRLKFGFHFYSFAHIRVALKHTRKTIGNLMGFNVVNYWSRNSDNLLVGRMYGTADLGIYNRGYTLLTTPLGLITGLIGSVLYPSLKKLKSSEEGIRQEYLFILKMITFIAFPISFIFIVFPEQLVHLLWGKVWMDVAKLLPYFGLLLLSQSLTSTVGNMLVLVEKEQVLRISGWISSVVIISAIGYGATISLVAIAQCYSIAFIVIVIPINIYYVFIGALGFTVKKMVVFWSPIILFSVAIWLACFYEYNSLKTIILLVFLLVIAINAKDELLKISKFLRDFLKAK